MFLDIWSEFSIMKFYNESIQYEFSTMNMHQFYKSQNKDNHIPSLQHMLTFINILAVL